MKRDREVVYVPAGIPGATLCDRVRMVIAMAFAERDGGMDAEPDMDDMGDASVFDVVGVSWVYMDPPDGGPHVLTGEMRVTVTGPADAVRAYRAALRAIA